MSFDTDRAAFTRKRMLDEQKKRALAQFGGGKKPDPTPEPPRPTKMPASIPYEKVEAVA